MNVYFLTVVFCGTLLQNIPIQNEYIYKSSFILSYFYVLLGESHLIYVFLHAF